MNRRLRLFALLILPSVFSFAKDPDFVRRDIGAKAEGVTRLVVF